MDNRLFNNIRTVDSCSEGIGVVPFHWEINSGTLTNLSGFQQMPNWLGISLPVFEITGLLDVR